MHCLLRCRPMAAPERQPASELTTVGIIGAESGPARPSGLGLLCAVADAVGPEGVSLPATEQDFALDLMSPKILLFQARDFSVEQTSSSSLCSW